MNERIRQLAEQAGLEMCGCDMPTRQSAKFAELIVKETMQVVANNLPQNTYLDVADAVIEHFGVTMNKYPSYCCQKCGELIGWLGRIIKFHKCKSTEVEQ